MPRLEINLRLDDLFWLAIHDGKTGAQYFVPAAQSR